LRSTHEIAKSLIVSIFGHSITLFGRILGFARIAFHRKAADIRFSVAAQHINYVNSKQMAVAEAKNLWTVVPK
jgi:hypothetical protein